MLAVPHREFEDVLVQVFGVREFASTVGEFAREFGEVGTGSLEEFEQVEWAGGARSVDIAAAFGQERLVDTFDGYAVEFLGPVLQGHPVPGGSGLLTRAMTPRCSRGVAVAKKV